MENSAGIPDLVGCSVPEHACGAGVYPKTL